MTTNQWDPGLYEGKHSYVWKRGGGELIDVLHAAAGERILDAGCGTGNLTRQVAESGAKVIGVDFSESMIAAARENFPTMEFRVMSITDLKFDQPFDAVFSNAALHWVMDPIDAIRSIHGVLKPNGRLVLEMGGRGNIETILNAVKVSLEEMGFGGHGVEDFLYFPSVSEYSAHLEANGFEVRLARLFDRPTPLEEGERGLRNWVRMFKRPYLNVVPESRHEEFYTLIEDKCCASLHKVHGWYADYRRLQIVAVAI